MANSKNLKPQAHKLTVEDQSKGGKKSGEKRRERADLRKMVNDMLCETFTDSNGNKVTGMELLKKTLIINLTDPKSKNWSKALEICIRLTGADLSETDKKIQEKKLELLIEELKKKKEEDW